jgi:hypothetical protein
MSSAFKFLKPRSLKEQIDISALETKYSIYLPPVYKLFASTFHLGSDNFRLDQFYHPEYKDYYACGYTEYTPLHDSRPLLITHFESLEELFPIWEYSKEEKEWTDFKFLRIADIGVGGGLFLGTQGDMADCIYRVVWDWDEDYEKITNNIFEFVRGLELVEDESYLYGFRYSQLFKNWGDEFWHV